MHTLQEAYWRDDITKLIDKIADYKNNTHDKIYLCITLCYQTSFSKE